MKRVLTLAGALLLAGLVVAPAVAPGVAFAQDASAHPCGGNQAWGVKCAECVIEEVAPGGSCTHEDRKCPHQIGSVCLY